MGPGQQADRPGETWRRPRAAWLGALVALIAAGAGCQAAPITDQPARIAAAAYQPVFRAAGEVLRDYGFAVVREDYRFGRLESAPRRVSTPLEFWRGDNSRPYQALEGGMKPQRRIVRVWLTPEASTSPAPSTVAPTADRAGADAVNGADAGSGDGYHLVVEVVIESLDDPRRHMTGSPRAGRMTSRYSEPPEERRRLGLEGARWRPVERDPYLEARLRRDILARSQASADQPGPGQPAG